MTLRSKQSRIVTLAPGAAGSLLAFIIASLRTWQWQTSSPCTPVQLKAVALPGGGVSQTAQMAINGTTAYISSGDISGPPNGIIYMLNIANPQNPTVLSSQSFNVAGNPPTDFGYSSITFLGTTVYAADATGTKDIVIINAANPAAPVLVSHNTFADSPARLLGRGSLLYILSGDGVNDHFGVYNGSLVLQGSALSLNGAAGGDFILGYPFAYVITSTVGGVGSLYVIDVRTPKVVAGPIAIPGTSRVTTGNGNKILSLDGTLLYVMCGSSTDVPAIQRVFVYDVTDPANPSLVNTFVIDNAAAVGGLDSLFVAEGAINMTAGLGPIHLVVYSTAGAFLGSALVASTLFTSGAIARAA